jgi:phi13 family phage major tail protein
MANTNKVEFGLSNVHVGTYTVDSTSGAGVLGAGKEIKGAVSLFAEPETNEKTFYADNVAYYSAFSESGEKGELVMALFPDSFKVDFLGYKELADGGIARAKGAKATPFWIAFQGEGDTTARRRVLLNVIAGQIKREHRTIGENKEVEVETLPISVIGDNKSGFVSISYSYGDTGYSKALTAPTIPALATSP